MGTDVEAKQGDCESSENVSELERKIIRQVEYYFGNVNLFKDKFLREQIKLDDGWIPLETLVKFNRLKILSEDPEVICKALRKSTSNLMEVSEDSTKVRRNPEKPLPENVDKNEMAKRTLYVKGFKRTTTLDELLDFFREHKAEHIAMRHVKPPSKGFKGSCFVVFETLEDCEKFLGLKGIKYQGTELLREKKNDYIKRKDLYFDNLRKEREQKNLKRAENLKKDAEANEVTMIPGCLLKFTGLTSEVTREDIREPLEKYGNIVFTDYFRGNPEGVVRFETGVAAAALEGASTEEDGVRKIQLKPVKATVTLLEGDDEKEYWKNIAISRAHTKIRHAEFQKQNRGRFNKNRNWGKRKGRSNRNDEWDQPAFKKSRTERNGDDGEPASEKAKTETDGNKMDTGTQETKDSVPPVEQTAS